MHICIPHCPFSLYTGFGKPVTSSYHFMASWRHWVENFLVKNMPKLRKSVKIQTSVKSRKMTRLSWNFQEFHHLGWTLTYIFFGWFWDGVVEAIGWSDTEWPYSTFSYGGQIVNQNLFFHASLFFLECSDMLSSEL